MTKNSSKSTFSAPFDLSWHKSFLLFILLWNTYIQLFVLTFALSSWPIWPILGHFRGSRCVKMTQNGSKSPCYESEPLYICLCIWNIVDRVIFQHFYLSQCPIWPNFSLLQGDVSCTFWYFVHFCLFSFSRDPSTAGLFFLHLLNTLWTRMNLYAS